MSTRLSGGRAGRLVLLFALVTLAACATPRDRDISPVAANPHYKIGTPYTIAGRTYTPRVDRGYDEVGVASWYGDDFHGKLTANGEIFDMTRLSAAHKTLPMPVTVEVTNLDNGRRIFVRLNDRGPFVEDRIIDLSRAAAAELGFLERGLANVRVRYVADADLLALADRPRRQPPVSAGPASNVTARAARVADAESSPVARPPAPGLRRDEFWVNIQSFDRFEDLEAAHGLLAALGDVAIFSDDAAGRTVHHLRIGPFRHEGEAHAALSRAAAAGFPGAALIRTARS